MFGCDFNKGSEKQEILTKLKQEHTFQNRLEKNQTKNAYETALSLIEEDIKVKAKKVSNLLIESFFTTLNAPLKTFEQKLKNDEEILQNQINSFEENDKNRAELSINIHKNIKKLENISTTIKGLY